MKKTVLLTLLFCSLKPLGAMDKATDEHISTQFTVSRAYGEQSRQVLQQELKRKRQDGQDEPVDSVQKREQERQIGLQRQLLGQMEQQGSPLQESSSNQESSTSSKRMKAQGNSKALPSYIPNSPLDGQLIAVCDGTSSASAETLINQGASPNARKFAGKVVTCRALHLAALTGNAAVIKVLLAHNAAVDTRNIQGRTPLHFVAEKGDAAVCKLLLEARADLNAQDGLTLNTPLHLAIRAKHYGLADFLVHQGADATIANSLGETSLTLAERSGNQEFFDWLLAMVESARDNALLDLTKSQENDIEDLNQKPSRAISNGSSSTSAHLKDQASQNSEVASLKAPNTRDNELSNSSPVASPSRATLIKSTRSELIRSNSPDGISVHGGRMAVIKIMIGRKSADAVRIISSYENWEQAEVQELLEFAYRRQDHEAVSALIATNAIPFDQLGSYIASLQNKYNTVS